MAVFFLPPWASIVGNVTSTLGISTLDREW